MQITRVLAVPLAVALVLLVGCGEPTMADRLKAADEAMAKGDIATALIELKSGLRIDPNSGELRYRLGSLMLSAGDVSGAVLELRKAVDQGYANDAVTAKLAIALVASGKFKDVTDTYSAVALTDPAARAQLGGAVAAAWLGQRSLANARKTADETLKHAPDHGPALLVQARLMAMDYKFDQALALAERAAANGPGVGDAHLLRALLLGAGKKDRQGAIAAFEQAAKDPPTALGARSGLIQLHLGGRDLAKAKGELALLQKSHPTHPSVVYLSAVVAYAEGKLDQVESLTDALLKLAPGNAQILTLSGAGHLRRGALVAAETKLGRVVQTVEKAPLPRKLLADTYLRMGQTDKALAALSPLLAEGGDADALAMAAQAHLQKGQVAEAVAAFNAALKIRPDDVRLRTSMALTDLVRGAAESAFDALQQLAAQDGGQTADLALISAHLQRREFDRALVAIDRLEKKQPKAAMPLHLRGVAQLGKGDAAGARGSFEAALAADPAYFQSIAMLVSMDSRAKNHDAAQSRIEAAVKQAPRNLAARMALVEVLKARGSPPDRILGAIDEAVRTHPTEAAPHLARLAHLSRYKGAKEAVGHAQVAMSALPNHPQILDAAGLAFFAADEDQQSQSAFNRLASTMPSSPLPYLRLADVHAKRGNRGEAAAMLGRAFEVAPASVEVHRRLLDQAARYKDYKVVLAAAKDLQRQQPASAAGYLLEGDAEASRKSWPAAKAAYQAALTKPDGQSLAPRAYYVTLKRSGETAQAERFAGEWIKANPKDVNLRGLVGSELIVAGRLAEAERHFREIVEIVPSGAAALNNLAWLMAQRKDPAAVQLAERAVELAPNSATVLDTLAKALVATGQIVRAVGIQRRAIEGEGSSPMHRLSLARLLTMVGDLEGARAQLDLLERARDGAVDQAAIDRLRKDLAR